MDFWSKFCFSSISWEGQKALQKGADDGTAPTHQAPIALSYWWSRNPANQLRHG